VLDMGFLELVVVFVIGLLVLGPERLPRVARTVGLWVGRARAMFYSVRSELERELRVEEMRKAGYELKDGLEFQKIEKAGRELEQEVKDSLRTDVPPQTGAASKDTERAKSRGDA